MIADEGLGPRLVEAEGQEPGAHLLRRVSAPRPLSADATARIYDRVLREAEPRRRRARVRWWALASLGVAGVAGAATICERIVARVFSPSAVVQPPEPRRSVAPRPVIVAIPEAPAELPAVEPQPTPGPERPRTGGRRVTAPPAPAPRSALADESALLEEALRRLRHDRDGAGAIAALDRHRARFPDGQLRQEADRTRLEALLLQGKSAATLEALDAMALGTSVRDLDLAVLRGELRAQAGRCADSERDFAAVLARPGGGAGAERALFGRASCRSRRGDQKGAREDLQQYLARFPDGKFAGQVRQALAK